MKALAKACRRFQRATTTVLTPLRYTQRMDVSRPNWFDIEGACAFHAPSISYSSFFSVKYGGESSETTRRGKKDADQTGR
jgi:hypothetical protein